MEWQDGHVWVARCQWPEDGSTRLEFKYIVQNPDRSAAQWQPGANREVLLDLTQDVALVQVQDEWSTGKQIVRLLTLACADAPAPTALAVKARRPKGSLGVIGKELDVAFQRLESAVDAGERAQEGTADAALQADVDVARAFQLTLAMMQAEEAVTTLQPRPASRAKKAQR
ncbi:hypothetical protein QBZ16_003305 [Prototheca wickerhamii]|uniref:CBM20 domain-containing protein n=1 Tax=Prototheca wickerhamii TaxID=3111 RepID=A0AAD9MKP7_PROWI|nr:hypothetical protein QBZ16_003305 [Prototheca wickerhamii]